jgi:hypothetical protein
MVMTGRKPSDRPTVTRHKPTVDWTDVINVPYTGEKPTLPETREVMNKAGDVAVYPITSATRDWFDAVCSMPHCVLWGPSDWQFAVDTALVHAQAAVGVISAASELRQREKIMGTTVDARRDLRIRYVDPEPVSESLAPVNDLAERRKRLADA